MRIISRRALREFGHSHPDAETPLDDWYRTVKRLRWSNLIDVRETYPHEVDPKRYGRLPARKLPAVIRTDEENERLIAELEQPDQRYAELAPEEQEYSELLTVLIAAFEDANYTLGGQLPTAGCAARWKSTACASGTCLACSAREA